ncbi:MAG: hypothetical protein HDR19_00975 [Lachnospiraceae bacterium]|nr:hypothetical protein [Lachnospiraceae bacterium]
MNAKEQLEKMVGSDFMVGLSEMTRQLETAGMTDDIATEPEVLAVDVVYDPARNKLGADVWIYFGKSPEFSVVQVELLQDGVSIAKNTLAATVDAAENVIVSGAAKKEVKATDIKVHVKAVGKSRGSVAKSYDEVFSAGYVLGMSDVVKDIEVKDPRNIRTPQGSPIHVSFDRAQQLKTVDYDYTEYRVESGLQDAYLDMSGDIHLSDGYEYIDGSYTTDKIFLQNGDDRHVYENGEASISRINSRTIHYEYNKKWNCTIPKSVKTACSSADLRSQATFKYKETASGKESTCIVVISSKEYSLGSAPNNYKKIPSILFYWGCLEENTEITMADGSHKKIKNIRIGEEVLGTDREACEVRNVIRGMEDMLICITLESGKEIFLTHDHPFKTKKRETAAINLEFGDEILTESGYEKIEGARPVNGSFNVCSLEISPSDFIWGNGIAVGDYGAQGMSMKALEAKQKSAVSEKIVEECRKINEMYYHEL